MLYGAHLFGLLLVGLVSLVAAWWVRGRTRTRAGTTMVVLLVGHATMALLTLVQFLGPTMAWQVFWYRAWFSIGLLLPVVWFLLAVYYTGRDYWLTRPVWALLVASPLLAGGLWVTDPYLGVMSTGFAFETEPFDRVTHEFSPTGVAVFTVLGLFPMVAFVLFAQQFFFPRRHSRWKAGAVLVGILVIWASAWVSDTTLVPAPGFPYTQYGSGVFGVLVAIALFRTGLFTVSPLAHETIFESIEDAVIVVDTNTILVDFNEAANDLFPTLHESIGDPLEAAHPELLAPTDGSRCDGGGTGAVVERLDRNGATGFADAIRVSTHDSARTLRISVSEVSSRGEPRGYALIMRDVTDLERHALELEHKTEQLERFASALSHDLRNPVSVASGYVELTRETGDLEHLTDATAALERIEETIDDLLTLAREGETIDELERVSLVHVVEEAWLTSDTRTVVFENAIEPGHRIRADPSRTRTLLENLFRNAADHGAETVRVEPLESGTGFAVADDGPGIDPEVGDRVFEYGYTSADGTGLGLSIVASVATAHGWSVSVTESDDGGARFEIANVRPPHSGDGDGSSLGNGSAGEARGVGTPVGAVTDSSVVSPAASDRSR
ncbi:histidine kinase N-terminal 7TM domain-containing protein [Natronobiforma cellulositropha]|uniref:histidine kinase N-terminal 7TM domain-containing protein n=1 Tax=Natronobiforma cellulositropha TaxID=1679076 RepID=UPI0021D5E1C6|nr:histidine kinase N-terminal 7TM domain-containing protein [Natronobiforma cellulositropha]